MSDEALLLQTLDWAVQMLVQVDVVASRDGSWPERITPDDQLQYVKELRIILAYLRAVRDRVECVGRAAGRRVDLRTWYFFNVSWRPCHPGSSED
jgi:hypothetical protein